MQRARGRGTAASSPRARRSGAELRPAVPLLALPRCCFCSAACPRRAARSRASRAWARACTKSATSSRARCTRSRRSSQTTRTRLPRSSMPWRARCRSGKRPCSRVCAGVAAPARGGGVLGQTLGVCAGAVGESSLCDPAVLHTQGHGRSRGVCGRRGIPPSGCGVQLGLDEHAVRALRPVPARRHRRAPVARSPGALGGTTMHACPCRADPGPHCVLPPALASATSSATASAKPETGPPCSD